MTGERLEDLGKQAGSRLGSLREAEYKRIMVYLAQCQTVLDVGCGTGTLLAKAPGRFKGVDLNPENVAYCSSLGLDADLGDALALPFEDASFDGVVSSHVMQCFTPSEAATHLRELARITRVGGVVVISTLNWFPQFFRHPENARPYPPQAVNAYFAKQSGSQSPTFGNMPVLAPSALWCRRPPLVTVRSARRTAQRIAGLTNRAQYQAGLRKWWTYDAYVAKYVRRS